MAYIGNQPAESFTSFATQEFSTSATTSYTLDHAVTNENEIALFVNNVRQQPGSGKAYTATGTALTLSAATASTDTMYCVFLGRALQTVTPVTNSITNAMLSENSQTQIFNSNFRNLLINGDMSIAQRGTSATALAHTTYGTVDRISQNLTADSFVCTGEQSTDAPDGFDFSFKVACTTADTSLAAGDRLFLYQRVEDRGLSFLQFGTSSAKSLTLSFYVKSNKTGTYQVNLWHNNASKFVSATYTIDSANTWERKILTFIGDTSTSMANDSASALQVEMVLLGGTTYTSGSVSSTYTNTAANRAAGQTVNIADSTSNTWQITGMQLEIGTAASDFLHVPHDVNLQRCQRYYYRINPNGTSGSIGAAAYYTSSAVFTMLEFPTSMRTNPSLESATGTNYYNVNRNSDNDEFNDFSLNTSNIDSAHLYTDSNVSSTAGHAGRTRFNSASGYVAFSAEL